MPQRPDLIVTAFLAVFAACQSTKEIPLAEPVGNAAPAHRAITTETLQPHVCGSIARMHTLAGVFLASQPKPEDFQQAKAGGIRTVFNLRHDSEITAFDERATVEGLGLEYVSVPWNGPDELTDEIFARSREVLAGAERPLLVHCGSANRVGAIWLAWRAIDEGLPVERALEEAKTVGLSSPEYERLALDYVRRTAP